MFKWFVIICWFYFALHRFRSRQEALMVHVIYVYHTNHLNNGFHPEMSPQNQMK